MQKLLRGVRGAVGMGLTWAVAWASVGFVPRWVLGINNGDLPYPILFFGLGFISGVTFSVVLMLTEGRRRLDQLSVPRVALWGALGGILLGGLFVRGVGMSVVEMLGVGSLFAVASAACASGTLMLARRAAMRELPNIEENIAELDPTDAERQLR